MKKPGRIGEARKAFKRVPKGRNYPKSIEDELKAIAWGVKMGVRQTKMIERIVVPDTTKLLPVEFADRAFTVAVDYALFDFGEAGTG